MENFKERIQDYIEGQLQGEELQEFESHMQQDTDFRNLVNLQKEIQVIINKRLGSGESELRKSLSKAKIKSRFTPKSLFQSFRPLLAIASAACILLFGYLFFLNNMNDFYDLPAMQSEIVRGQESNNQYEEAVKLYNQKSYSAARNILNKLIMNEPEVVQYQYYAALTYLGEENWTEACKKLSPLAEGHSVFKDEAKYYLAVSLNKSGNKPEAIKLLKSISKDGSLGEKVQKLLNKLD